MFAETSRMIAVMDRYVKIAFSIEQFLTLTAPQLKDMLQLVLGSVVVRTRLVDVVSRPSSRSNTSVPPPLIFL